MEDFLNTIPLEEKVLTKHIEKQVKAKGDQAFFQHRDNEPVTYGQMDETTNRIANSFIKMGIKKGENVSMMLPNCNEYIFSWFGLAKMGGVKVPINTAFKGDMLQYIIDHSDSEYLIISDEYLERLKAVQDKLPKLREIIIVKKDDKVNAEDYKFPYKITYFEGLYKGGNSKPKVEIAFYDPLTLLYTSGTTGPSKGVICTHAHSFTFAMYFMRATGFNEKDTLYTSLPFFHTLASTLGTIPTLISGTKMGFLERFSATRFWQDVQYYKATVAHVIFSIPPILAKQPITEEEKNNSLRCMYLSQRDPELEKRWNLHMVNVYGSTEIGISTYVPFGEEKPVSSCGRGSEIFDQQIVDDYDKLVPTGEIGELIVRPKYPWIMFQQFYNMPEQTLEQFRNLWYHTGDRLKQDEDGFYYFVDRKKDAIRFRGENISSYEIEKCVNQHPSVLESAAIGVPSELLEDEVKVCIVLKSGEKIFPEELHKFCLDTMPKFMIPRYIEILNEMPKSASEKIQKYKLRSSGDKGITKNTWDSKKEK